MWVYVALAVLCLYLFWKKLVRPLTVLKHSTVTHNKKPGPTFFRNRQGLWLYTHLVPPVNKDQAVGRVFFAHGFGDHCQRRHEFIKTCTEAGYVFCGVDHQGFGRSEGDRAYVEKFSHYVDDYEDFVSFMNSTYPEYAQLPSFLIGGSMGGTISILLATRNPAPWKGVILLAPAIIPDPNTAKPWMVHLSKLLANVVPKFAPVALEAGRGCSDPEAVKGYIADPLTYSAPNGMRVRWGSEMLGAMDQTKSVIPTIEWPFIVFQGSQDVITNPKGVEHLYEQSKSKDKTLKVLGGWWHALFDEPKRQELYAHIIHWMNDRA